MAYYDKYKITFATKTSKTVYLYIQEDLVSAPTIVEYIGINVSLEYIPSSDDAFEPIFASQLNVTMDVTDDLASIPEFTSINDRKYFCKLFLGNDLEWCGYLLNDNIQISFSTGRKEIAFSAVDGLGMLKEIPLPITNLGNRTNDLKSVLYYMQTALNALSFPTNPNLFTVCSYFAGGMTDRTSGTQYEPFSQTYLPIRTFKNEDYTYEDCLTVLEKLLKSFGCRLFQAGGKWWVVAVNEFANENNYFTQYSYLGAVVSSGSNLNTLSTIQGYTNNTSGLYFVDNSQIKLLLKGFNKIDFTITLNYDKNLVDNGNFRIYTGVSNPTIQSFNMVGVSGGTWTITDNPDKSYAVVNLVKPIGGGYVRMINPYMPNINAGDIITFSMLFDPTSNVGGSQGNIVITVTDGVTTYHLGQNLTWYTSSQDHVVPELQSQNGVVDYSITAAPCPISGTLTLEFSNRSGGSCGVSNFNLTLVNTLEKIYFSGKVNNNEQYKKELDIEFGYTGIGLKPTSVGVYYLSDNTPTNNWYRYGNIGGYTGPLAAIILKQCLNIYARNIINIDASVSSFVTTNANYPYLNASKMIKATDTDPAQINVSAKSYMLGNSTVEYIGNSMSTTLLEISNTDIISTINYVNFYK